MGGGEEGWEHIARGVLNDLTVRYRDREKRGYTLRECYSAAKVRDRERFGMLGSREDEEKLREVLDVVGVGEGEGEDRVWRKRGENSGGGMVKKNEGGKRRKVTTTTTSGKDDIEEQQKQSPPERQPSPSPTPVPQTEAERYKQIYEKIIPAELRERPTGDVTWSKVDKAALLKVDEDGLTAYGHKGYRSVRCRYGVVEGDWYFEIHIGTKKSAVGHFRVGFGTRRAQLEGPVGCDSHGYALRDTTGEVFHEAKGKIYAELDGDGGGDGKAPGGIQTGHVVGCRIHLPETIDEELREKIDAAELAFIEHRLIDLQQGKVPPEVDERYQQAFLEFFLDGKSLGIAQTGLAANRYYPTLSLYKDAEVRANFGPYFEYPPPTGSRPMSDLAASTAEEGTERGRKERHDNGELAANTSGSFVHPTKNVTTKETHGTTANASTEDVTAT